MEMNPATVSLETLEKLQTLGCKSSEFRSADV